MHSVYHFYDCNDDVLYIGMSANPFARADQHCHEKDMTLVSLIKVKWFAHRDQALAFERAEVSVIKPPWNIKMTGRQTTYCKQVDAGPPTQEELDRDNEDLRRVLREIDV